MQNFNKLKRWKWCAEIEGGGEEYPLFRFTVTAHSPPQKKDSNLYPTPFIVQTWSWGQEC